MKLLVYCLALCIAVLAAPRAAFAQTGTITGKIVSASSKNPLERASVFLNNATYGTATGSDGTFTLSGVRPGQYDLVVSSVGYELYSQTVLVGKSPVQLNIELKPKTTELRDVVITTPEGWRRNYAMFVKYFIGTGADAMKCRILNPHDLYMVWHKSTQTLEASSDEFIIIENQALGYHEKILLEEFKFDGENDIIQWRARTLFEDMEGSKNQKRKWLQRRDDVYYGYAQHFLRSLAAGQMNENGFEIRTLVRKPNPQRPPEKVIAKKIEYFRTIRRDSFDYWVDKEKLSKWDDRLLMRPMLPDEVLHHTEQPGIYAIVYKDYLYVTYKNRYETEFFKDVYRPLNMENYEASIITLTQPYALFDTNGTILNGATLFEGSWTKNKGAELLPLDFTPTGGPPSVLGIGK